MSPEECLQRAYHLALSAFLGDTIYNFGELVRGMSKRVMSSTHDLLS